MYERTETVERIRSFSHVGLWVLCIALCIGTGYSAFIKKSESNEYSKGAKHEETSIDLGVHEYPLSFGCARFDLRGNDLGVKKDKKGKTQ